MIECSFCQTTYVNNTVFCNECGNYLPENDRPDTGPLDDDEMGWVGDTTGHPRSALSVQAATQPQAIRLNIGAGERQVEMPLSRAVYVGRLDPASDALPEIDLTHEDVLDKCISRRHAKIFRQGNRVVVEDLGSTNGTFINGEKVAPFLPESLNDGDTMQLGKLLIEVSIL